MLRISILPARQPLLSSGELSRTDVFCYGTRSLVAELEQNGIRVVTKPEDSASVVLIGFDTENTSEKVRDTCIMLGREVAYLATNPDLVCPVSFGYIPDCGSMSIMLKKCDRQNTVFHRQARTDHDRLCFKKSSASPKRTP